MKIALYYPWIYLKSGAEKIILEIAKRSRHEWTIFTNHYDKEQTFSEFKHIDVRELSKIPVNRGYLDVIIASIKIAFQKIDLSGYKGLMVNSEGLGDFISIRNHELPMVCYCYTPLKVIHDPFMQKSYLKKNPFKIPFFILFSNIFSFFDKYTWKRYSLIMAVSEEVRNRIIHAKLTKKNIEIMNGGVDTKIKAPSWQYRDYFLHPGRIKWYRNIELTIDAFNLFCKNSPDTDFKLIIAGQVDKGSKKYAQYIKDYAKNNQKIEVIENPDEQKFDALLRDCYLSISTTPNEDFGIVILESMAYGKPVVAIDQGGPKEIIEDNKNGFLLPLSAEEISKKLTYLSKNRGAVMAIGKNARERSLSYDWDIVVDRLDSLIDKAFSP